MKKYTASTTIKAPTQKVWEILTNAEGYPAWDPGMDHIEGKIVLGETVKFVTKLSSQAFPVKVTIYEPNQKLVLTGGMPMGLFKSERTHTLTSDNQGHTVFHTEEIFSGALLPVFGKNIPDLTENFRAFCDSLKKQAEQ